MSRALTILYGRAHSGKSRAIAEAIRLRQRAGERAVLIVPEQYTYEAERVLSSALDGLLGVQALSLERLCERVLTLHGMERPFLSAQGYRMVIRRTAFLRGKELAVFARAAEMTGFCEQMAELFAGFKRAGLTPEMLGNAAGALPEGSALRDKLGDAALLYADTEAFLAERYLTSDDVFNAACALLPQSFVRGLPVYIDGLDAPDAQMLRLLGVLLDTAGEMTVALRMDEGACGDAALFEPDRHTCARLIEMAEARGIPVRRRMLNAEDEGIAPALRHLERNLYALPGDAYCGAADGIALFGASSRRAETEALADAILERARRGVRYREMAVIVSDMDAYAGLIERAFRKRNIPVFLDKKRPVTGHAAVDTALSAVRAVTGGYRAEDVLRLVKSGDAGVSDADGEELENFLLRTGLRGTALTRPFVDAPEGVERAREAVIAPLERLRAGLNGRTIGEKARALYAYLVDIGLDTRLKETADALLAEGRIPLMEEHAQVWRVLMDTLSQMDAILGDVAAPRELFARLMTEGLSGCAVGVIPDTADQVLLGDVGRTRSRAVKALFVVGCNEGLLPALRAPDGLIDDGEVKQLREMGYPTWSLSTERQAADDLELYTALSKARETLYISWAFAADGEELAPSHLVARVRTLFPGVPIDSDVTGSDALPACASSGLDGLTGALREYFSGEEPSALLPALLRYYLETPAYAPRARRMLAAGRNANRVPALGREAARTLYGARVTMSASRLENFNGCAFRHFVRYGLRAETRKEHTEKAEDVGRFYHAALEAFVRSAGARGMDWGAMRAEDADALMDAVLPDVIAAHNGGIFLDNERLRAALFLLVNTVKASARAVAAQLGAGRFRPRGAEMRFGAGEAFPPLTLRLPDGAEARVAGVIDRVDAVDCDGRTYVRVIDYKTSGREYDFIGILQGLTLQLPLYLAAVAQEGGAAGMYYMPVREPAAHEEDADGAEEREDGALKLRGITVNSERVLRLTETDLNGASAVLADVKPQKGENGAYQGSLCTERELMLLMKQAREVSERTFGGMMDGHIEVNPAEGACKYCEYRTVCRFDPTMRGYYTRKYGKIKAAEFFARIGGGDELDG